MLSKFLRNLTRTILFPDVTSTTVISLFCVIGISGNNKIVRY